MSYSALKFNLVLMKLIKNSCEKNRTKQGCQGSQLLLHRLTPLLRSPLKSRYRVIAQLIWAPARASAGRLNSYLIRLRSNLGRRPAEKQSCGQSTWPVS